MAKLFILSNEFKSSKFRIIKNLTKSTNINKQDEQPKHNSYK
jgi:hypothetical protein